MPMLADAHISSLGYLWENSLSHAVEAARDLHLDFQWSCHGTVTSCMSRLGQINRVKHCFDNCTLILIINALVIITNGKKRWMVSWKRKIKKNTEFRASVGRYWKYSRFPFVWLPELRISFASILLGWEPIWRPVWRQVQKTTFLLRTLEAAVPINTKKSDELWLVGIRKLFNYGLTKFFTKLGQRTREVLVAHVAAGRDHHVSAYWGLGGERSASPR